MAEMTLYGLPMQKVRLPNQTGVEPDGTTTAVTIEATAPVMGAAPAGESISADMAPTAPIPGLTQTPLTLNPTYQQVTVGRGSYYRAQGGTTLETGERPVLPLPPSAATAPRPSHAAC